MAKKQHSHEHGHQHGHTESAQVLLAQYGFKVTKQRLAVLTYLIDAHEPCSIESLSHAVPSVNQVTLYRMLKQFVDVGLVYQTDFRSGKAYFEFQAHHHHHIVCTSCGTQEAVETCLPASFVTGVAHGSKGFTKVLHHTLEFFGICKRCAK
jgi:Fe2+ or Zn2+ uptake regulation protein